MGSRGKKRAEGYHFVRRHGKFPPPLIGESLLACAFLAIAVAGFKKTLAAL